MGYVSGPKCLYKGSFWGGSEGAESKVTKKSTYSLLLELHAFQPLDSLRGATVYRSGQGRTAAGVIDQG